MRAQSEAEDRMLKDEYDGDEEPEKKNIKDKLKDVASYYKKGQKTEDENDDDDVKEEVLQKKKVSKSKKKEE